MYKTFDVFIGTPGWHEIHPIDEEKFYEALHVVIHRPDFNPDELGDYMRLKRGIDATDKLGMKPIHIYVSMAWAVKRYLKYAASLQ